MRKVDARAWHRPSSSRLGVPERSMASAQNIKGCTESSGKAIRGDRLRKTAIRLQWWRLITAVGDEHDRLGESSLRCRSRAAGQYAHRIHRGEGFVHQQDGRIGGERSAPRQRCRRTWPPESWAVALSIQNPGRPLQAVRGREPAPPLRRHRAAARWQYSCATVRCMVATRCIT